MAWFSRLVRTYPMRSKRRAEVVTEALRIAGAPAPLRFSRETSSTSSRKGMLANPPSASKRVLRTSRPWSPYGLRKTAVRTFTEASSSRRRGPDRCEHTRSYRETQSRARARFANRGAPPPPSLSSANLNAPHSRRRPFVASSPNARTMCSSYAGGSVESACRKRSMSPFAARAPALHCEALPLGAERTAAPAARASATVSSSLPPSTTITSGARPEVDAHARALSTARRTFPASFSVGTTTVMVGRFWARGFGGRRAVASAIEARVAARASRAAVAIAMLTRAEETREAHNRAGRHAIAARRPGRSGSGGGGLVRCPSPPEIFRALERYIRENEATTRRPRQLRSVMRWRRPGRDARAPIASTRRSFSR